MPNHPEPFWPNPFKDRLQRLLSEHGRGVGSRVLTTLLVVFLIGWLPVFLLEQIGRSAWGIDPSVSFLYDYAALTYMASIPFLVVTRRIFSVEWDFVCRNIFNSGILTAEKSACLLERSQRHLNRFNRPTFYLVLYATSLALSIGILFLTIKDGTAFWFSTDSWLVTPAGLYHWILNVPIFLAILLYWVTRYFLWFQFLREFSRSSPIIHASHPDRTGGLGFLSDSTTGLCFLMFAIGAILSATVLYKVNIEGVSMTSLPVMIIMGLYTVSAVIFITGPLLVFTQPLFRARKEAILDLTRIGLRYGDLLNEKEAGSEESFDVLQAQADLSVVFQNIHRMKIWPIDLGSFIKFLLTAVLPLFPLLYELVP